MQPNRSVAWGHGFSLTTLCLLLVILLGCRQSGQPSAAEQPATSGSRNLPAEPKYVYIDSVPRGAHVSLENDQSGAKDTELGVTPLRVEPDKVSGKKVVVMMFLADLVQQMKAVPGLREEAARLQLIQEFSSGGAGTQDEFVFFDTSLSRILQSGGGGFVAVGPEYSIDIQRQNRVCAYFIPRGVSVTKFYPLMPADGTFHISKYEWAASTKQDYHFSDEQAIESAEALSRSGRFQTVVLSQTVPGSGDRISMTVVGEPPNDESVIVTHSVGHAIKGIDY